MSDRPVEIVNAARAIVEADGVDALSMRKLAAELGVAPTAIYWHVGVRDDVLHAVLNAVISDLPPIAARGATPRARLGSVARSIRDQVRATTTAQQVAQALGRTAELSFPGQVALARELGAAGVHGEEAARSARALLFLVGGFILLEDNFAHRAPGARTTQDLWRALDDDTIDAELRQAMSQPADTDALFDYAIDQLLASLLGTPNRREDG